MYFITTNNDSVNNYVSTDNTENYVNMNILMFL